MSKFEFKNIPHFIDQDSIPDLAYEQLEDGITGRAAALVAKKQLEKLIETANEKIEFGLSMMGLVKIESSLGDVHILSQQKSATLDKDKLKQQLLLQGVKAETITKCIELATKRTLKKQSIKFSPLKPKK